MDNAHERAVSSDLSAKFHEQLVQSLTSGVIAVDATGTIIMANAAAAKHLGIAENQLAPGYRYQDAPLPRPFADILTQAIRDQQPLSRHEIVLNQIEAPSKEIGLSVSPIQGPNGFQGVVVLFVDMTERRTLERSAELNSQLAQVGELAAGVVHEVRNPLSVIVGTVELLQRKIKDEAQQQQLRTILTEARNIESGINDFLGFAKPFDLVLAPCRAEDIMQRAYQLCQAHAEKKKVKLVVEVGPAIPELRADAPKLAQALANIVSNGIDAAGGGTVKMSATHAQHELCFEIFDTGPGISIPPGKSIFAPFFTQKAGGTGLGLAICHRIVTAHGGSISYICPPEGGTRFHVRIPLMNTWDFDTA